MRELESLLRDGVDTAYELQGGGASRSAAVKERVLRRGRRRRAARMGASALFAVVLVAGVASTGTALWRRDVDVAGRTVPDLGAEQVFGTGPAATDGRSLWVGGERSNTAGDLSSIARMDLSTGDVVDCDPAVALPHEMALGESGLWTTGWSGDMPAGGEGHPVRGAVQRVDPETLERNAHIPVEGAPYDVAVGQVGGREVVWVVDFASDELLGIDGETAELVATHPTPHRPVSVLVHAGFVYVTSSDEHVVVRMDPETGETSEISVPDCANDVEIAFGSLWVADYCGDALLRIDEDGAFLEEVASIDVGEAPIALEIAEGLVWVSTQRGVVRVDPDTDEVVGNRVSVTEFFMGGLVYAGGDMWAYASEGVYRLREGAPPATPPPPRPTKDPRGEPVPAGVERIDVSRPPHVVAAGDDWLWAGVFDLERIGAATGEPAGEIEMGHFMHAVRFDEDAGLLWALVEIAPQETAGVVAIDPETDEIVLGPVRVEPANVSGQNFDAAGGAAWVPGRGGILSRVDATTGRVTEMDLSEHFDRSFNQEGSFHVAATGDAVLVLATDGTVVRVDVASGKHSKVEDIGVNVADVETDGTSVWVAQESADGDILLWTLDASTGERTGEPLEVARFGFAFVSEHEGTVWVAQGGAEDGMLVKAFEDGAVVKEVRLPGAEFATDVDAGPSGLWVTTGADFLYRVATP